MSLDTIDKVVEYLVDRVKVQQKELDSRGQYEDGDAESREFYSEGYGRLLESQHMLTLLKGNDKSSYDVSFEFSTSFDGSPTVSSWDIVNNEEELKYLPNFLRDVYDILVWVDEDVNGDYQSTMTDEEVINTVPYHNNGDGNVCYRLTMSNLEEDECGDVLKLVKKYKLDKFVNNN